MAQLYARVFVQILDSSIAEDFMVRHVFEDMMKVCDMVGHVDMTRTSMARRFNVPLEELNRCIEKLESEDPHSRDEDFGGRRIERLDEHRDWGWRILNYEKYEQIRTRADVAIRVQRHRAKKAAEENGVIMPPRPRPRKTNRPLNVEEVIEQGKMMNVPEVTCRAFYLYYEGRARQDENGNLEWWIGGENNQTLVGDWRSILATWWVNEQAKGHEKKLRRRDRSEAEKEPGKATIKRKNYYGESGTTTKPNPGTGATGSPGPVQEPQAGDTGAAPSPPA